MKLIKCIALFLALCLLAGCGGPESPPEEEYIPGETIGEEIRDIAAADDVFSLNSDQAGTFNPYTDTSVVNHLFMPLVFETMYELDTAFNPVPKLVLSAESSNEGITWMLKVDTSVCFSDGSSLTAADVAYSLNRAKLSHEYGGRLRYLYGTTAMSDDTLMVSLYKANTMFPSLLNLPVIKNGSADEIAPVGTGPYRYNEDHTALELWKDHPKAGEMPIETIYLKSYSGPESTISAFEDSLIDLVENDPTGVGDLGYGSANEIRYCPTTNMHYLGFNQKSPFFCYPQFRDIITYTVNRDYIVTTCMGGCASACTLPISPIHTLYNTAYAQYFNYSMERAATSMRNVGVQDLNGDGLVEYLLTGTPVPIKLDFIVCGDSAAKVSAARDITENLRKLGFDITLRELTWNEYQSELAAGKFDMYYAEVKLSADFNLSELIGKNGTLNFGGIEGGYDEPIDAYLASTDETRRQNCEYMCKFIAESSPIVPILFEKTEMLTHRGVVSGASPTQYNLFYNFENWTIELT